MKALLGGIMLTLVSSGAGAATAGEGETWWALVGWHRDGAYALNTYKSEATCQARRLEFQAAADAAKQKGLGLFVTYFCLPTVLRSGR